jgi:hypothetical protein
MAQSHLSEVRDYNEFCSSLIRSLFMNDVRNETERSYNLARVNLTAYEFMTMYFHNQTNLSST